MSPEQIRAAIETALHPGRFFVQGTLDIQPASRETIAWEIFRGHLLDARQTRQTAMFVAWNLRFRPPGAAEPQPVLSFKFSEAEDKIHVVRFLLVHGWEAFEEAPNVIGSRPAEVWRSELVGAIDLTRFPDPDQLAQEVSCYIRLAIVGTSRLPITSVESPLPAYSLGQLAYAPCDAGDFPGVRPIGVLAEWIERGLSAPRAAALQHAAVLETVLRAADPGDIATLAGLWAAACRKTGIGNQELVASWRALFNQLALTPYTALVDNLTAMLARFADLGFSPIDEAVDVAGYFLRHLVRHLAAFDLVTFHNRGANYPDALLLDSLLKLYLEWIERQPEHFEDRLEDSDSTARTKRLRRRALRQGAMLRKRYEHHRVPDAPTSPGEQARVLPGGFPLVPEEQLLQPARRRKTLYEGREIDTLLGPVAQPLLRCAMDDLADPSELRELGMGIYLDRPLGIYKLPGEVDRTPLLSYEAFSRQIARERLDDLHEWGWLDEGALAECRRSLDVLEVQGVAVAALSGPERPGVVTLEDARLAAHDFVFLRTTRDSLDRLLSGFDLGPLDQLAAGCADWLRSSRQVLLIRHPGPSPATTGQPYLTSFDSAMRPRMELELEMQPGGMADYVESAGVEYPAGGLLVLRAWELRAEDCTSRELDCRREPIRLATR